MSSCVVAFLALGIAATAASAPPRGYCIPIIDLSGERQRQVIVDSEPGQYLGHPTTVLLEDGKTMLIVYPKSHGRGAIVYKRSTDAGLTWSERLPVPKSWATSMEVPTLHRPVDAFGKKRLIMFSGLCPVRMAVSEDDGGRWSELKPIGNFGGVVTMASCVPLKTGLGYYMASASQLLAIAFRSKRIPEQTSSSSFSRRLVLRERQAGHVEWVSSPMERRSERNPALTAANVKSNGSNQELLRQPQLWHGEVA